jgi:hypothetical protein
VPALQLSLDRNATQLPGVLEAHSIEEIYQSGFHRTPVDGNLRRKAGGALRDVPMETRFRHIQRVATCLLQRLREFVY